MMMMMMMMTTGTGRDLCCSKRPTSCDGGEHQLHLKVFVLCVCSAKDMVEKFQALDKDGSGKLDVTEVAEELKAHGMGEKEVEFFITTSSGDDGLIDIGEFAGLLLKLKVYEQKKKS